MTTTTMRSALLASLLSTTAYPAAAIDTRDLNRVADRGNQGLPRMVATNLRQERIEVDGMTVVYLYTHLALDSTQLRELRLEATQRPFILPQLCAASDTGRMLREGVKFRYVYRGRDGAVGGDLVVAQSDCRDVR